MFEDLLKKLWIWNTTPTQQGKDALNTLLANTNTGVQYTDPTAQEQQFAPLNTLLANTNTNTQFVPSPNFQPQPTALDNVIGNIGDAYNNYTNFAQQTWEKWNNFIVDQIKEAPKNIVKAADWRTDTITKPTLWYLWWIASVWINAYDNAKTDRKYIGRWQWSDMVDYIQWRYDIDIEKAQSDPVIAKKIVDDINNQIAINEEWDIQWIFENIKPKKFTDINQVADYLLERNSNNQQWAVRSDKWSFDTPEQKAKRLEKYNTSKKDPVYANLKSNYDQIIEFNPKLYLSPVTKAWIRAVYETTASWVEETLIRLNSQVEAMKNTWRSEKDIEWYKMKADMLKWIMSKQANQIILDWKEAAEKWLNFETYLDEKYKDTWGFDWWIRKWLEESWFNAYEWANRKDVADSLTVAETLLWNPLSSYQQFKQTAVWSLSAPFQWLTTLVRRAQWWGIYWIWLWSEFSSAWLAWLADVDFSGKKIYSKWFQSYAGEAASLIPDALIIVLPWGQYKAVWTLWRIWKWIQTLNSANKIKNAVLFGWGWVLRWLDYWIRWVSLAKDIVTLNVLDDIRIAKNLEWLSKVEKLYTYHNNTLSKIGAWLWKTAQELAKDSAISGMFSNYIAEAYGGQDSKYFNDVTIDTAFNIIDLAQAFWSTGKILDWLNAFSKTAIDTNKAKETFTWLLSQKSLSLKEAEQAWENITKTIPLVSNMLKSKSPEDFATAYKQYTGKDIPIEKVWEASEELRRSLARAIVNEVIAVWWSDVQQIAKLRDIDSLLKIWDKSFNSIDTVLSSLWAGVWGVNNAFKWNLLSAIKTNEDLFGNQWTFKSWGLWETLGLTVPEIKQSDVESIKGIMLSQDKNIDDFFTKQDNGNLVLKQDKYEEVWYEPQQAQIIDILEQNAILTPETLTELKALNAEDELSKAIWNILC